MPMSIRDLSSIFCVALAGCQSVPYQAGMEEPTIPIRSPTDIGNAADPASTTTKFHLLKADAETSKVKTHLFRWPFTKECGSACTSMWALSAIAVGLTIAIITSHHGPKGCVIKVVQCSTWPNCNYPPPPPGCTYDLGG